MLFWHPVISDRSHFSSWQSRLSPAHCLPGWFCSCPPEKECFASELILWRQVSPNLTWDRSTTVEPSLASSESLRRPPSNTSWRLRWQVLHLIGFWLSEYCTCCGCWRTPPRRGCWCHCCSWPRWGPGDHHTTCQRVMMSLSLSSSF